MCCVWCVCVLQITSVVVFAKGQGHFLRGFLVLGVALLLLFLSTAFLLWHIRSSDAEPRLRYLATFQSLCLVFLCICILVVLYEPQPPCDCPDCGQSCDLSAVSNLCVIPQALSTACFGSSNFRPPLYTGVNSQSCQCAFNTATPPYNCSLTG